MSKIEWTEKTWNPITGCTKVSSACKNCYAEVMTRRLQGMGLAKYSNGFKVTTHPELLDEPEKWTGSQMVFVCSMSDLFHEDVPYYFIDEIMSVIKKHPQHTFQILTKRSARMADYFSRISVPENVWMGVTCEKACFYNRIEDLASIKTSSVKFVSCEPLLGELTDIPLKGIDWVITGGESGVKARWTRPNWFRSLRDQCIKNNVPFFFKQWGAFGEDGTKRSKYENGALLDGREWKEYPRLQKRELKRK